MRWRVATARDPSPLRSLTWSRLGATGVDVKSVVVAVPDIAATGGHGESLRSVDGGRTWGRLARPFSTGIQAMPDGVTMYATSDVGKAGCWGAVYRSNDAGAHWQLLKNSCVNRALYAVMFVDREHGFAAGGTPTKFGGSQIVEATEDGGRTWKVRWSTPLNAETYGAGGNADGEVIRLAFTDARHGFALTGGCTMGQNGPCGGRLYATSDAGHHWRTTGLPGLAVAASATGDVYVSGTQRGDSPALAISIDAGHHWAAHSPPIGVFSQPVAGSDGVLWWQTTLGTFTSRDGGKRWSLSTAAALATLPKYAGPLLAAPPHNLLAVDPSGGGMWSSHDDAATSSDTSFGAVNDTVVGALGPGGRAAALVGFGDTCTSLEEVTRTQVAKPGWLPETRRPTLYTSADGGTRWHAVGKVPFLASQMPRSFALSSSLIVVMDACSRVQISTDNGHSWLASTPPTVSVGCVVSVYGSEIWLQCPGRITHSGDRGATWVDFTFTGRQQDWLGQPLQAVGPRTAVVPAGGSLWRTVDDGAHWVQTWPTLTGES